MSNLMESIEKKRKSTHSKHIQVTMSEEIFAQVKSRLAQNGDTWQTILYTALEVYIAENEIKKTKQKIPGKTKL